MKIPFTNSIRLGSSPDLGNSSPKIRFESNPTSSLPIATREKRARPTKKVSAALALMLSAVCMPSSAVEPTEEVSPEALKFVWQSRGQVFSGDQPWQGAFLAAKGNKIYLMTQDGLKYGTFVPSHWVDWQPITLPLMYGSTGLHPAPFEAGIYVTGFGVELEGEVPKESTMVFVENATGNAIPRDAGLRYTVDLGLKYPVHGILGVSSVAGHSPSKSLIINGGIGRNILSDGGTNTKSWTVLNGGFAPQVGDVNPIAVASQRLIMGSEQFMGETQLEVARIEANGKALKSPGLQLATITPPYGYPQLNEMIVRCVHLDSSSMTAMAGLEGDLLFAKYNNSDNAITFRPFSKTATFPSGAYPVIEQITVVEKTIDLVKRRYAFACGYEATDSTATMFYTDLSKIAWKKVPKIPAGSMFLTSIVPDSSGNLAVLVAFKDRLEMYRLVL